MCIRDSTYAKRKPAAPVAASAAAASVATELKGVDVFVEWPSRQTDELAAAIGKLAGDGLSLEMIDNRGCLLYTSRCV